MAYFEIRIYSEDTEKDGNPEVVVEFYHRAAAPVAQEIDPGLKSAALISASKPKKPYDTVTDKSDLDGNGLSNAEDQKILLDLANAFASIDPRTFSR